MVDVRMPDGTIIQNVPEGITKDELLAKLGQKPQTEGLIETALKQGAQGATFGFSDEIMSGIGALIASGVTDEDFSSLYKEAQQMQSEELKRQQEQNPKTAIGSQIAGGLATGLAGATTKGGQALGQSLMTGPLPTRALKAGAVGATSGAISGAGTAEQGQALEGAVEGGLTGAAIGGAIPVAGQVLKTSVNTVSDALDSVAQGFKNLYTTGKLTTPKIAVAELESMASDAYKFAAEKGGILKPRVINTVLKEVQSVQPQTRAGKLLGGDDATSKVIERLGQLKNSKISLAEAQEIDEFLGDAIDSFVEQGRLTKQGRKLLDIQSTFRRNIERARPSDVTGGIEGFEALKEGRKLWSSARKLRDIEKIITRAELTDNPATSIKTGFRTLLLNDKRMRGFTKTERELIEKAARSGAVSDALRVLGSPLNPIIAMGSGAGFAGTAAAQAGATLSRGGASALQVRKAAKVAEEVARQGAGISRNRLVPRLGDLGTTLPTITGLTGVE